MKYISLFSGAGGLDIGLERVGFEAVSLCEIEKVFCETIRVNKDWTHNDGYSYFYKSKIFNEDIRNMSGRELCAGQDVDLIVGGPPCQAFSSSGKQLSILDPRGALVSEFCRIIDEVNPKVFLFENVRGLVTARDKNGIPGGVIKELLSILSSIGYSCRARLLNSADYGAYQRRVRCFIIGSRNGSAPAFPKLEFEQNDNDDQSLFLNRWRKLEDFLINYADKEEENFIFPGEKLFSQLNTLPNGSGIKSPGKSEKTRPNGHWGYRQGTFIADLNLPARTVTGSQSQDWVRWNGILRRLTLNEVIGLQGFPSDWIFAGNVAQKFKQVGNAVPTIFGEVLGQMIISHLNNYPNEKPVLINFPIEFEKYIDYTKKDHEKNKDSRSIHRKFA
ncbi:MAG TPA: DNA cytosine methyltransferase [Leptospiraceae bacterium]|nr:DNA cytosine methyltransferase [Leptospiraceae bacterium]